MSITPFKTTFAVPMTCGSCVTEISDALYGLPGITKVDAELKDQLVFVEGTAPPSAIVGAIQKTGRDAILRGSGNPNSAAVCILEVHSSSTADRIRGLTRLVQVSPSLTLMDLTIRGLPRGEYCVTIRETGDISHGAASTGGLWKQKDDRGARDGRLERVAVGDDGRGSTTAAAALQIWEIIGRAMVVSPRPDGVEAKPDGDGDGDDDATLVGVIARSAGVWDNDKTVCSCSGKTLWEERRDQVERGML